MSLTIVEKKISKAIKANFEEQTSFLANLVRTRSVNPFTPEESKLGEPVELEMAEVILKKLKKWGLRPRTIGASKNRPNVVCYYGARRFRKSLLFLGHMDTAAPSEAYTLAPFSGAVRNGRLFGVGSYEMKGSLSAYLYAVKALMDAGIELDGRLILALTVDEQPGACSKWGTEYVLSRGVKAKAAIVGKPGTGKIAIGHRGGYRFKLTTIGEAVHTGVSAWEKREQGKNAIVDMARIIAALQEIEIPYKPAKAFPGRQPLLTFPVKIQGGTAINVVPDRCTAYGDVRLLPGNSDRQVQMLIRERLQRVEGINYEIEDLLFVPSVEVDNKEEIVELLAEIARQVLGKKPELKGAGPWNDSWMLVKRDIPTICGFGPDGGGAHEADEWVDLNSLRQVTEIYSRVALKYLGYRR